MELQKEFMDSNFEQKHIRHFLTQQFPVEDKKVNELSKSSDDSWYSASSLESMENFDKKCEGMP